MLGRAACSMYPSSSSLSCVVVNDHDSVLLAARMKKKKKKKKRFLKKNEFRIPSRNGNTVQNIGIRKNKNELHVRASRGSHNRCVSVRTSISEW